MDASRIFPSPSPLSSLLPLKSNKKWRTWGRPEQLRFEDLTDCPDVITVGHGIVETTWEANSTFFDGKQRISVDFRKFRDFLGESAYNSTRSRDVYIEFCLTEHWIRTFWHVSQKKWFSKVSGWKIKIVKNSCSSKTRKSSNINENQWFRRQIQVFEFSRSTSFWQFWFFI